MVGSLRNDRFIEIDLFRGVLVVLMVAYHSAYSGMFTGLWNLDLAEGSFAWWSARIIATGFVFTAGVSQAVQAGTGSRRNGKDSGLIKRERAWYLSPRFRHGGTLLALGAAISLVTWLAVGPQSFVAFGVLHLLGILKLADSPLSRMKIVPLLLGACMVVSGVMLGPLRFDFPWLFFLGLRPDGYHPVDYLPVLPWAGWYFLGVFAGNVLYPAGKAVSFFKAECGGVPAFLAFLGRHSLSIYVCHVPVVVGLLYALRMIVQAI